LPKKLVTKYWSKSRFLPLQISVSQRTYKKKSVSNKKKRLAGTNKTKQHCQTPRTCVTESLSGENRRGRLAIRLKAGGYFSCFLPRATECHSNANGAFRIFRHFSGVRKAAARGLTSDRAESKRASSGRLDLLLTFSCQATCYA